MKSEIEMMMTPAQASHKAEKTQHYLRLKYPMEIIEDEDGVVATIPDLPGCASFGDNLEDAIRSLNETKELWIKGRIDSDQPVPEPSQIEDFSGKFVLRIPRSLHRSLDREAKKQGVSLNQYVLHLLSERHAKTKIEEAIEQSAPLFFSMQKCYLHVKDAWVAQMSRVSISSGTSKAFEGSESLLPMLDFLPKPKGFREVQPVQKAMKHVYQGKL